MKMILKIAAGIVLAVIVLVVACGVLLSRDPDIQELANPTSGVTMAQFNQLTVGMSESLVRIVLNTAQNCELMSESSVAGIKTSMFQCDGSGSLGANMNFMIQDGKLISKAQFGLQ